MARNGLAKELREQDRLYSSKALEEHEKLDEQRFGALNEKLDVILERTEKLPLLVDRVSTHSRILWIVGTALIGLVLNSFFHLI